METISLNELMNYRLNDISKIKDYFESEMKDQKHVTKKLSKHITCFDYTDKVLTFF